MIIDFTDNCNCMLFI